MSSYGSLSGYPRCSNRDAFKYVANRQGFKTNNGTMYAVQKGECLYVVYSYGEHFPLALYDSQAKLWLHNSDRYSPTTSRHFSHIRGYSLGEEATTGRLKHIIDHGGVVNAVDARFDEPATV